MNTSKKTQSVANLPPVSYTEILHIHDDRLVGLANAHKVFISALIALIASKTFARYREPGP